MPDDRAKEIERVRRSEIKRGSRHPSAADEAYHKRLQILIEEGTEEEFARALTARGWLPGSPAFDEAVAAFRAVQRQHRSRS